MKRFHIHVGVKDLQESVLFYSNLFGKGPVKLKKDYAKWLIEDPRVNFAISTRAAEVGLNHLGIQVETTSELEEVAARIQKADMSSIKEETTCCYAKSSKVWTADPSGIAWEAYQNMEDAEVFGNMDLKPKASVEKENLCLPKIPNMKCC